MTPDGTVWVAWRSHSYTGLVYGMIAFTPGHRCYERIEHARQRGDLPPDTTQLDAGLVEGVVHAPGSYRENRVLGAALSQLDRASRSVPITGAGAIYEAPDPPSLLTWYQRGGS